MRAATETGSFKGTYPELPSPDDCELNVYIQTAGELGLIPYSPWEIKGIESSKISHSLTA